jgi:hypothetical protein
MAVISDQWSAGVMGGRRRRNDHLALTAAERARLAIA